MGGTWRVVLKGTEELPGALSVHPLLVWSLTQCVPSEPFLERTSLGAFEGCCAMQQLVKFISPRSLRGKAQTSVRLLHCEIILFPFVIGKHFFFLVGS